MTKELAEFIQPEVSTSSVVPRNEKRTYNKRTHQQAEQHRQQ